jgi:hypothetical protein
MTARRFPLWSRIAFAMLLPVVAYNIWGYVESRRLESRLDAIRRRGEPTSRPYQHPEGDAARAERFYRAASALVTYSTEPSIEMRNRVRRAWLDGRWAPETLRAASVEVAENREALNFVDRAAGLPFVGFVGGTSYNYQTGDLLSLARLCELRAGVLASERNADAALASFYTEARLVRVLDLATYQLGSARPTFSGLSSAMANLSPSVAAREAAAQAFVDIDHDDRLYRSLIQYRTALLERPPFMFPGGTLLGAPRPLSDRSLSRALDDFDRLLTASKRPWPERIEAMNRVGAWPTFPYLVFTPIRPFAGQAAKVLNEFTTRTAEQVRNIRCARLLMSPRPPELVDPFSGKPLEVLNCHL